MFRPWVLLLLAVAICAPAWGQEADISAGTFSGGAARSQKDYAPFPQPDAGYVTDLAHQLTPEQEEQIERWLWETESRTGVEIVVVTVRSLKDYRGSPNSSIERFARGLFDAYGIGNMPENNGVLLLVAVGDRKARIELGAAYGRRRDAEAQKIMDEEIVSQFRKAKYAKGIKNGVKAIMLHFGEVRVGVNWSLVIIATSIPILGLVAYSLFKSGKRGWGWICVGFIIVLILAALFLAAKTLKHAPRGRSSGWSSGGFGGGFGGGFSGGGGATGSW